MQPHWFGHNKPFIRGVMWKCSGSTWPPPESTVSLLSPLNLIGFHQISYLRLWGCVRSQSGCINCSSIPGLYSPPAFMHDAVIMHRSVIEPCCQRMGVCLIFGFPPDVSQAAARHQCLYLVQQHSASFLEAGGEESWLNGLEHAPTKLRSLQTLNKLLAHRPWLITQQHIQVGHETLLLMVYCSKALRSQ